MMGGRYIHRLPYMNAGANLTAAFVGNVFAALGDRARLRIACCLLASSPPTRGGLCVCELVDSLGESQPNVSRHLRLLQAAGLVTSRREGRWIYYDLRDAQHPLLRVLRACLDTVCSCADIQHDLTRLRARLTLRRGGKCVVGAVRKGGVAA